jgi:hypothetical protein
MKQHDIIQLDYKSRVRKPPGTAPLASIATLVISVLCFPQLVWLVGTDIFRDDAGSYFNEAAALQLVTTAMISTCLVTFASTSLQVFYHGNSKSRLWNWHIQVIAIVLNVLGLISIAGLRFAISFFDGFRMG